MEDKYFSKKHYVLVHGGCHGAWCWFKLKPLMESIGYRVTMLDMAASGINLTKINEIRTAAEYSEPLIQLMASLPDDEKVVIVGHSLGGLNIALAMEMFPHKIAVAVFLTAFMPDSRNTPSFVFDQFAAKMPSGEDFWLDTEFMSYNDPNGSFEAYIFGTQFLSKLYRISPIEDLMLAITLRRPTSFFLNDIRRPETKLSKERYGSVKRVYVVSDKDEAIPPSFQWWMIENDAVKDVRTLQGSDHMPMLCIPKQLCSCLHDIAQKYC
ncbi:Salicylic acid-binding protein 2 [Bienertia sinuspersici]